MNNSIKEFQWMVWLTMYHADHAMVEDYQMAPHGTQRAAARARLINELPQLRPEFVEEFRLWQVKRILIND